MMNVSEYASDVGLEVKDILSLCKKLDINVSKEEDMLSDDDIIILDQEIASNIDSQDEDLQEEMETFEDSYEEELEPVTEKKPKKKVVPKEDNKSSFKEKRKEMYKHKEKLQSNVTEDNENTVLYKDNMTVSELATSLEVNPTANNQKVNGTWYSSSY